MYIFYFINIKFFILQALIEKDWLSFGHKFSDRCGYVSSDGKELAPIFTQFIDATYQLLQQYPYKFQFNEYFLYLLICFLFHRNVSSAFSCKEHVDVILIRLFRPVLISWYIKT